LVDEYFGSFLFKIGDVMDEERLSFQIVNHAAIIWRSNGVSTSYSTHKTYWWTTLTRNIFQPLCLQTK